MKIVKAGKAPVLVWVASFLLAGCATEELGQSQQSASAAGCEISPNLIGDPGFVTWMTPSSLWSAHQHGSDNSFAYRIEGETLSITRTNQVEPWAMVYQDISEPGMSGKKIRYEAEVTAEVSAEVEHLFGARAGLYMRVGKNDRGAKLAAHEPNVGAWTSTKLSYEVTVPEGVEVVRVGFLHQAGKGSISIVNPSLTIMSCGD